MRTQVRMRLWPFDSEIHKPGLLNHFLVCVTQNVGSRRNRSWEKKSQTLKRSSLICLECQLFCPLQNEAKGHGMSAMTA